MHSDRGLELVEDFQPSLVAGEVVQIEPPRHTDCVTGYLSGKSHCNAEMIAQQSVERWANEHRLAAEMLQGETLVSTQVTYLRSKKRVRDRLKGERPGEAKSR